MKKRVFISFAYEDKVLRDFLVEQARNENSPFEFIDMSVKDPWESCWKTNCRAKIKMCDGVIAIITNNTKKADGQLRDIRCAEDEGIPTYAILGHKDQTPHINELKSLKVIGWTWENIKRAISQM